jgi:hypothetical protein
MPVNTPHMAYRQMLSRWTRARDCFEGSDAVKQRGPAYLPMLDSHKLQTKVGADKYEEYKLRALFFNATGRTIEGMAGALFQTAPIIRAPGPIEEHLEDVTLDGTSAELFGLRLARELLLTGRYGILVDMPNEQTAKAAKGEEIRPYWIGYKAEDIYGWRTTRLAGREYITRVVLYEIEEEEDPKDPFVIGEIVQFRVLDLVEGGYTQKVFRKKANSDDFFQFGETLTPSRRGVSLPFIPFTFVGPTSVSAVVQKPPLDDLVNVNLSHYRTMADLEHGRHFTALPTPWVAGSLAAKGEPLAIGSGVAWALEKEGRAGMLEFSGAGLESLVTAEQDKRKMMAVLGARLLEDVPSVQETMGAVSMRHAGEQASLRTIAQSSEHALSIVLRIHAWWVGTEAKPEELKEKAVYEVNKDFFTTRMSPDELRGLIMALQAEAISYETFYAQLTRGEIARPGVTAEEEQTAILERSQALAALAQPAGFVDPNDPNAQPEADPTAGEEPGDKVVASGDWWKIVSRKKKFVLLDAQTGETYGTFGSQREAEAAVKKMEEEA